MARPRLPLRALAAVLALVVAVALVVLIVTDGPDGQPARDAAPSATPSVTRTPDPTLGAPVPDSALLSYVINTSPQDTALGEQAVASAGGTVIVGWPQIGVVVARSTNPGFAAEVRTQPGVQSAGATRTAAVVSHEKFPAPPGVTEPGLPPEGQAYDVAAIGTDRAHALPGGTGSREVLVAVLDNGIEDTHPDLDGQVDAEASAGCTDGGRLRRDRDAWLPTEDDHGTHVAGTIAALDNGFGVVGVAPGVRLSSVKVVDDDGLIYPEYAICGYLWAATSGAQVTNASLYVDPWQYWCPEDPDQAAAIEAVGRAVAHATAQGVLHVAAAGNDGRDLTAEGVDTSSPNDTLPAPRPISDACLDLPTELPGVLSVAATGPDDTKVDFSNYGLGKIAVAAPGLDVWSTTLGGTYGVRSGTSMSAPHVAGAAALLASRLPGASPAELTAELLKATDVLGCPVPPGPQRCYDTDTDNAFFGAGLVDAYVAAGG